ncbi:Bug family tripartite tricarboxylate transporter substrate binding protein [Lutibaculum baratangense]|uniref:Putative tricarboxylic transport TctC n=1 Tax=Lutibaculum baratangense AMV1 TaxID=631454 RepID=V4RR77_9HYPH|nr:tripartite tricarboxylate transporter substrate binding protein [Lutibaculum baratangense]ESR25650.1 putative tricarboxylic transport TctC [Lutibaculum baratangense AMV1]
MNGTRMFEGRISLRRAVATGVALAAFGLAGSALAQDDFPTKKIEIVSHAAPGGGTDITARMWMDAATAELGQDFVIVYKQGGGARSAHEYAMSKEADGYTVVAFTPTHLYSIARGNSPASIDDFTGLARAMQDPSLIVVRADSEIESYDQMIEASKERALNWGVAQVGGTEHIGIARWADAAGVEFRVVPFGSGGEMITALRSGAIDATLANVSEALSQIQNGELRAIAVLADEKVEDLPDVPTAAENGHDVSVYTTRGYMVKAGTPPERVQKLSDALVKAMQSDRFKEYLTDSGLDPDDSVAGSEEWDAQLKEMYAEEKAVIDRLGLANQ